MAELKPCPFCGCEYEKDDDDYCWSGRHADWCPLSAKGGLFGNLIVPDDAASVEAWNKRAGDSDDPESLRPHGRWEEGESGFLVCSECADVFILEEWIADGKWKYCPNCGAKMRLKGEEDDALEK